MRRSSRSLRRWARRFGAGPPDAGRAFTRPLIPLAFALAGGIAAGALFPGFPLSAAAAAAAAAAGTLSGVLRRKPMAAAPLALTVLSGYLALQPWTVPCFSPDHVRHYIDRGRWEITGVVDTRPAESDDRTRFILRAESLRGERGAVPVSGLLRVTLAGAEAAVGHGDRVSLVGRIRSIRSFNNPGGFDFKRHQQWEGVFAAVFVGAEHPVTVHGRGATGLAGAAARARTAVARGIEAAVAPPESAVLKALIVGERAAIPPETQAAFRRSGTAHLLAISGLHFALLAAIAFPLFRRLLGWVPALRANGGARKGAALLTLLPVGAYALLAGMSPATQRALAMISAFLLALLLEREQDALNTLALAALTLLAAHPPALFSISFQLSFAAVFAILYGFDARKRAGRAAEAVREPAADGRLRRLGRALGAGAAVSLLATWGTLPLVLQAFNSVSLVGLPANLAAVPLIGYAVVLPGLCGAFALPLSPELAGWCFQAAGAVLSPALAAIHRIADWPFAACTTVTPSAVELILFYAASLALIRLAAALRGGRKTAALRPAAAALALCLLAGAADAAYWAWQRFGRRDLRVTVLDVGAGSAVLLELPGGRTVLVDGGGFSHPGSLDVGAAVVAPFLWRRKIATVDTLALTHADSDHVNGLVFIAENFQVGELWTNGEPGDARGWRRLMRAAADRGIPAPAFGGLPRRQEAAGVRLEILHPPEDFAARRERERFRRDPDNNSLVLRACYGEVCVLIPGDIHHAAERDLVRRAGEGLKSAVLLAPHHGSRTSSSADFIAAVAPREVLVSCGGRAGSGPPHDEVLERYRAAGARVHRTDRHGALSLITDGRTYTIERYLESEAGAADGDEEGAG